MALAASAPNALALVIASLVVGVAATVAQQIVPFAAHLAPPATRGAIVGTVMAGLLSGILLSRTLAGFVATQWGWRDMFWLGVPLALGTAGADGANPAPQPVRGEAWLFWLIASLVGLWREFPTLRLAAGTQALLFAAFTEFWTILSLHLESPQFGLGAGIAGLFGVIGAVGIFSAPLAGRVADRSGPRRVIILGAALTFVAWLVFAGWRSLGGLVVGCIVLDFAIQSALVSNQHVIFALRPEARARINTLFTGVIFLGGSVGSAAGMYAWIHWGWTGVTAVGAFFGFAATFLQFIGAQKRPAPPRAQKG